MTRNSHRAYSEIAAKVALIFALSVGVNYPWELAQSSFYSAMPPALWHCFVASLGDGVLVLAIWAFGALAFRDLDWLFRHGAKSWALMFLCGFGLAFLVEWVAVYRLGRWTYAPSMPIFAPLGVALYPLLQLVLLSPLIFFVAGRFGRERPERPR